MDLLRKSILKSRIWSSDDLAPAFADIEQWADIDQEDRPLLLPICHQLRFSSSERDSLLKHGQSLVVHLLALIEVNQITEFLLVNISEQIFRSEITFCALSNPSTSWTSHQFSILHRLPTNIGLATRYTFNNAV